MKLIKKYTPVAIKNDTGEYSNGGVISFPNYSSLVGCNEFDTEEEAIEFAYENSKYATWSILPVIRFEPEYDNG